MDITLFNTHLAKRILCNYHSIDFIFEEPYYLVLVVVCCVCIIYQKFLLKTQMIPGQAWAGAGAASGRSPRPPHRSITGTVPGLIAHSDTDVVPI